MEGRLGSPKLQLTDALRSLKKGPTWFFYWDWDVVYVLALQIGVQNSNHSRFKFPETKREATFS